MVIAKVVKSKQTNKKSVRRLKREKSQNLVDWRM